MNRHEDDDLGHPSSESSRHGSSLLKYDDITILIEALTGQQYELKCSPTENVLSIKTRLARLEGISTNQQHIIFSGKLLDNESVLKDIGVANHSKLRLVTQMRGGPVNTRVIDDDLEEPDAEIAVVVLKDGERVSLVRFPINGSIYPSDLDSIEPLRKLIAPPPRHVNSRPKSRDVMKSRQVFEDNLRTENKMDEIRRKLRERKMPKVSAGPQCMTDTALPAIVPKTTTLPPINAPKRPLPQLKLPVPNNHSHFLSKYGLTQTTSTITAPKPPLKPAPTGPVGRPRCKKCGKRLGLAEQYKCRCGEQYCTRHRYAEEHDCTYDYQKDHKNKLRSQNRSLTPPKLPKI